MTLPAQLLVLAKEPLAGRSKTRLTPPLTPAEAAGVAAASLADTLGAVAATPVAIRTLVLDGCATDWHAPGLAVLPQAAGPFGARLDAAFADAYAEHPLPMLLIGMDTPQTTPELLTWSLEQLLAPGVDAVLGPAADGGWWALGIRRPVPGLFDEIPMSTAHTGRLQRERLWSKGLATAELPQLRDIDLFSDLAAVATDLPARSHVATLTRRLMGVSA